MLWFTLDYRFGFKYGLSLVVVLRSKLGSGRGAMLVLGLGLDIWVRARVQVRFRVRLMIRNRFQVRICISISVRFKSRSRVRSKLGLRLGFCLGFDLGLGSEWKILRARLRFRIKMPWQYLLEKKSGVFCELSYQAILKTLAEGFPYPHNDLHPLKWEVNVTVHSYSPYYLDLYKLFTILV